MIQAVLFDLDDTLYPQAAFLDVAWTAVAAAAAPYGIAPPALYAADAAVMIGDRPDKDVAGAAAAGLRAIRVRTGEYARRPDEPVPWRSATDVLAAIALIWTGSRMQRLTAYRDVEYGAHCR